VNPASRASTSAGSGFSREDATLMTPAERRAEAELAGGLDARTRGRGVVVDPRRPAGLEHQRVHIPPAEGQ
jgi:hypothetical protein